MMKRQFILCSLLIIIHYTTETIVRANSVVINEFMAANESVLTNDLGETSDWIELHNASLKPVDLSGWYLTDDSHNFRKWKFPKLVIPSGGYLVVYASGKNHRNPTSELHTNFKLKKDGEYLALVKPDGLTVVHEYALKYPKQLSDISYGLGSGGEQHYFVQPSPGKTNIDEYLNFVDNLEFSVERGFFTNEFSVSISTTTEDAIIRYTLDCSSPTLTNGFDYDKPIHIASTAVLRARAFRSGLQSTDLKPIPIFSLMM